MKKLVQATEAGGLMAFMGTRITLFCLNYIYTGTLGGVNDSFVRLSDAAIVYETGDFANPAWGDAQKLPNDVYVMLACVESFMLLKE
jgi:hypothetical protein